MSALDQASLILEYANIWVGDDVSSLVDLGAVRNVRFNAQSVHTKVNSDNRGTIIDKVRRNAMVEFDWLEPGDMNKIDTLFKGQISKSSNSASPVSGANQVVASGDWAYNSPIILTGQNASGLVPTINSVSGGTDGSLTVNVDYITHQLTDGRWAIIILDSSTVTTTSQAVTINTDYTPAASLVITGGTSQTATNRYVRLIAPSEDSSSVRRVIDLQEAVAQSDMLFPFVNVEEAGDVGVMPVTIEANKASTWTLTDEINPS